MSALWPDTVVEEANLAYNVSALRKALGEGRDDAKFIETDADARLSLRRAGGRNSP
jgi:DNA-binding winged helix-turn-helix (wHTH) protein